MLHSAIEGRLADVISERGLSRRAATSIAKRILDAGLATGRVGGFLPGAQADAFGYDQMGNAPHLLSSQDAAALESGDWHRADGEVACLHCGLPFRLHPEVQGCRWLRRTCADGLVKL